jgi:hypothetical protein
MNDAKYIGYVALDIADTMWPSRLCRVARKLRPLACSRRNLVMEATLETKAETILEFVHGLRGSLHVSFEEGTYAAWLQDLLKPHVTEVLVCDSRKNALLRVGNKNDREDARKLSELLFLNKLHPVYHGETGIRTLKEPARSYLTVTRDLTRVMNRLKAIYRGWGDCLCRPASVCASLPCRMAREDHRSQRAPSRRDLLSAVRYLSCFAPGSAPRAIGGIPETSGHEIAAADSLDRPDPRRFVDRSDADTPSLPYQAAAVGPTADWL